MSTTLDPRIRASRLAVAALFALSCVLGPASPAFATKAAVIKDKKAARAAIVTELDRMKIDLQTKMDDLASTSRQIAETQAEVDSVNTQLADVQTSLQTSRDALSARASALYRSDRIGMVEMLLGSRNIEDLIVRTHYLLLISERDATQLNDFRLTRSESLWLQESLARRMDRLHGLQAQGDTQLASIKTDITNAEQRALQIDADIAKLLAPAPTPTGTGGDQTGGTGTASQPDYNTLISSTNYRSQDMTAGAIQKFLNNQPGGLKSYSTKDHAGVTKTAAQMIYEAGHHFNISPRVILVTLQKEQSLLSKNGSANAHAWAMGAGKADSHTFTQYKGFGNQIWWGAQKLNKNAAPWHSGVVMHIDSSVVIPTNSATYSLYKYTPHVHGATMFWTIWWRYFDFNPTASPS